MKKVTLFLAICISLIGSVSAQTKKPRPKLQPQPIVVNNVVTCAPRTIMPDTAVHLTQQFFKELNGIRYRIVLEEYPYSGYKSAMLVYKLTENPCDMVPIIHFFSMPPMIKNFRILIGNDYKTLVALYDWEGEQKRIEFE